MIIETIMTKKVITVDPDTSVLEALALERQHKIRHLPVLRGGEIVGIVSDRDLRSVCPSILCADDPDLLENTTIGEIMKSDLITVHPLEFIEEAARLVYEHKIGCLPVVSGRKLVGIISEADILRSMVEMMGLHKPGAHFEVEVPNKPGMLALIAGIIRDHRVNIISVLLLPGKTEELQVLALRLKSIDLRKIIRDAEKAGFKVLWPLAPDGDQ